MTARATTQLRGHGRGQAGFTLLEVMIAMGLLVTILFIVWGSTDQVSRLSRKSEGVEELYRGVRLATTRMVHDISQAYVSQNEDTLTVDKRTFFVLEDNSGSDELAFTTTNHMRLYQDANESDQTVVKYFLETDPDKPEQQNLMRFEARRLDAKPVDRLDGETNVLLRGVTGLDFTVYDPRAKEWKQDWNTTSADGQPYRVPERVRLKLTIKDEYGKELVITTETFVYMQEALNLSAN